MSTATLTSPEVTSEHDVTDLEAGRSAATIRQAVSRFGPWIAVVAPIVFSAIELRHEIPYTPHTQDASWHAEMVRYATAQFRAGHFPLDGWFPYLSLGSPLFLHYQSLGAILAGLLGLGIGPDRAFSLTQYLLIVTWPISVYLGARLFGLSRWESGFTALFSPFIVSIVGIGFEQGTYLWIGAGVWSQLWAMWTLPLAWGFSWKAVNEGKGYLPAALFVGVTAAFHFESGYLAFIPIGLWVIVAPSSFLRRVYRAVIVAGGAFCVAAWAIWPLIALRAWSPINEQQAYTLEGRGYGARRILAWLFRGELFDDHRAPILTVLVGIGFLVCLARWMRDPKARALIVLSLTCLVLFFGPTTFGKLADVMPGSQDIFFRRFLNGVQMSGLLLAGIGAVSVGRLALAATKRWAAPAFHRWENDGARAILSRAVLTGIVFAAVSPMVSANIDVDNHDNVWIAGQRAAAPEEHQIDELVATVKRIGEGRVYAGMRDRGWGQRFAVGYSPVSIYLANDNVDEIGQYNDNFSLMGNTEPHFHDTNLSDLALYGIRFEILPPGHRAAPGARLIQREGNYLLWFLPQNTYVQVVDTYGPGLVENRGDIGRVSAPFLASRRAGEGRYPVVAFEGHKAAEPTLAPGADPTASAGVVIRQSDDLVEGQVTTTIRARRTSVVLLKATFDPGWTVTVDGRSEPTEMIGPAYVGVRVTAGTHIVKFRYHAYSYYPELFALAVLALIVLGFGPRLFAVAVARRRSLPHLPTRDDN